MQARWRVGNLVNGQAWDVWRLRSLLAHRLPLLAWIVDILIRLSVLRGSQVSLELSIIHLEGPIVGHLSLSLDIFLRYFEPDLPSIHPRRLLSWFIMWIIATSMYLIINVLTIQG